MRDLNQVMQEIYDMEQNVEINSFWDAGWNARIGDATNGFTKSSGRCDSFEEAVRWLEEELLAPLPKKGENE